MILQLMHKTFLMEEKRLLMHLKKKIPLNHPSEYPHLSEKDEDDNLSETSSLNETNYNKLYKAISDVDYKLDSQLIKKYFTESYLLELLRYLRCSQNKVIYDTK